MIINEITNALFHGCFGKGRMRDKSTQSAARKLLRFESLEDRRLLSVESLPSHLVIKSPEVYDPTKTELTKVTMTNDDIAILDIDAEIHATSSDGLIGASFRIDITYDSNVIQYIPHNGDTTLGETWENFNSCKYSTMSIVQNSINNTETLEIEWEMSPDWVTDDGMGDLSDIVSNLWLKPNASASGSTTITIAAWDDEMPTGKDEALTSEVTITIGTTQSDTVAPVFTVNSTQATTSDQINYTASRTYTVGDSFVDPLASGSEWVTAFDAGDKVATAVTVDSTKTSDSIDMTTAGTYKLYYTTSDTTGNKSYLELSVIVNPVSDLAIKSLTAHLIVKSDATYDPTTTSLTSVNLPTVDDVAILDIDTMASWSGVIADQKIHATITYDNNIIEYSPHNGDGWLNFNSCKYDNMEIRQTNTDTISIDWEIQEDWVTKENMTADLSDLVSDMYFIPAALSGSTTIIIEVWDDSMIKDEALTAEVTITIGTTQSDTVAPVFTVNSTQATSTDQINYTASRTYTVGDIFVDPLASGLEWVTAFDAGDDVATAVTVDSAKTSDNVDISKAGTYKLYYTTSDAAGNKGYLELSVIVNPVAKTITLAPTNKTLTVSETAANVELATVTPTGISASATYECFVNGGTTTSSDFAVSNGKLSMTKTLAVGSYSIVVKAENTESSAFALTVNADPNPGAFTELYVYDGNDIDLGGTIIDSDSRYDALNNTWGVLHQELSNKDGLILLRDDANQAKILVKAATDSKANLCWTITGNNASAWDSTSGSGSNGSITSFVTWSGTADSTSPYVLTVWEDINGNNIKDANETYDAVNISVLSASFTIYVDKPVAAKTDSQPVLIEYDGPTDIDRYHPAESIDAIKKGVSVDVGHTFFSIDGSVILSEIGLKDSAGIYNNKWGYTSTATNVSEQFVNSGNFSGKGLLESNNGYSGDVTRSISVASFEVLKSLITNTKSLKDEPGTYKLLNDANGPSHQCTDVTLEIMNNSGLSQSVYLPGYTQQSNVKYKVPDKLYKIIGSALYGPYSAYTARYVPKVAKDIYDGTMTYTGNSPGGLGYYLQNNSKKIPMDTPHLIESEVGVTSITLVWDKIQGASSYTLKYGNQEIKGIKETSYEVTGLTPDTSYNFTLTAIGTSQTTSNERTVKTNPDKVTLFVPTSVIKTVSDIADGNTVFSYTVTGADTITMDFSVEDADENDFTSFFAINPEQNALAFSGTDSLPIGEYTITITAIDATDPTRYESQTVSLIVKADPVAQFVGDPQAGFIISKATTDTTIATISLNNFNPANISCSYTYANKASLDNPFKFILNQDATELKFAFSGDILSPIDYENIVITIVDGDTSKSYQLDSFNLSIVDNPTITTDSFVDNGYLTLTEAVAGKVIASYSLIAFDDPQNVTCWINGVQDSTTFDVALDLPNKKVTLALKEDVSAAATYDNITIKVENGTEVGDESDPITFKVISAAFGDTKVTRTSINQSSDGMLIANFVVSENIDNPQYSVTYKVNGTAQTGAFTVDATGLKLVSKATEPIVYSDIVVTICEQDNQNVVISLESFSLDIRKTEIVFTPNACLIDGAAITPISLATVELREYTAAPTYKFYLDGNDPENELTKDEIIFVPAAGEYQGTLQYNGGIDTGEHKITVVAEDEDGNSATSVFTLTIADAVIDVSDETSYDGFKLDSDETSFTLYGISEGTETPIAVHELGKGIVKIVGNVDAAENFLITQNALKYLSQIYINGSNGDSTAFRDIVTIEGADDAQEYTIGNAANDMELLTGEPGQNAIYGSGAVSLKDGAKLAFAGVKNFNIESKTEDVFKIDGLTANVNIDRSEATSEEATLDFSNVELTSNDPGVVLNLGSANHQAALIGQSGSLRLRNGNIQNVVLSKGADTITGNVAGSQITDTSTSSNVVILKGGDNTVELNGSSTVVAKGESGINDITVNGDNSVVNLVQSQANNIVNVTGNNSTVHGGKGNDNITISGDYVIVSATQGGDDTVNVIGNNFSISTGAGNDDITVIGSNGNVSAGAGDDTIRVKDNENGTISTGNMISGGNGNDFIYAALSSGANIFYANSGNDFIIGGTGNDTIYGNSGNNLLAGGLGKDKINGGTGRDILIGSLTANLAELDETALGGIYDDLLSGWMNDETADVLGILGQTSLSDGQADKLKGGNDTAIDIFFANSLDKDIADALENDLVYNG